MKQELVAQAAAASGATAAHGGRYNIVIGLLMLVCASVSAYLSLLGAYSVFESAFISVFFAVAVQGAIFVALWMLPGRPMHIKALLGVVWAVAVSFAIGSAFLKADQNIQKADVLKARTDLTRWISAVEDKRTQLLSQAKIAAATAHGEETGSNGYGAGKRDRYRAAMHAKVDAEQRLAAFDETVEPILRDARKTLDQSPPTSLSSIQAIYRQLNATISASYLAGIESPSTMTLTNGPFERLTHVWLWFSGAPMDDELRMQTASALGVASLMEAICLLLALCRFAIGKAVDRRSLLERIGGFGGSILSLEKTLDIARGAAENIVESAMAGNAKVRREQRVAYMSDVKPTSQIGPVEPRTNRVLPAIEYLPADKNAGGEGVVAGARSRRRRKKTKPGNGKNGQAQDKSIWSRAIRLQAVKNGKSRLDFISDLLPLRGQLMSGEPEHFDKKQFEGLQILLRGLLRTGVLRESDKGFEATAKWDSWISYLFEQATPEAHKNKDETAADVGG